MRNVQEIQEVLELIVHQLLVSADDGKVVCVCLSDAVWTCWQIPAFRKRILFHP